MTAGTQKPWYQTWKLVPAILFFPITLIYLTWQSKLSKGVKALIIGVIIIGVFSANSEGSSNVETKTEQAQGNVGTPSPVPTTIPQTELTNEEKITELAKAKIDDRVNIVFDKAEKFVSITLADKDGSFFNETDMANGIWNFYIPYAKEVFQFDEVNRIKVAITTEFIDTYGNSSTNTAVSLDMNKVDFQKFNWDNLRFTDPSKNRDLLDKSNYFVHGLIMDKVKKDKLKISFL